MPKTIIRWHAIVFFLTIITVVSKILPTGIIKGPFCYLCPMDNNSSTTLIADEKLSYDHFRNEVLNDYKIIFTSREVSLIARKEVLTGKAKFGIFGDGKELAQVALAKFFQAGDFRSGYYRDQTLMFAAGLCTVEQFFAQLYADPDVENDPFSAGR